jgi:hypothetical protein
MDIIFEDSKPCVVKFCTGFIKTNELQATLISDTKLLTCVDVYTEKVLALRG